MPDERICTRTAVLLIAAATAIHLVYAGLFPLTPQEAYYWQWSRRLALSYFDHPPLVAWTIHATTWAFGHSERAVRLAAAFHSALFCAFLYLSGRRLFNAPAALAAVATAVATPIVSLGQMIITPDGPLAAAWMAAFYCTVRALQEERGLWLLGTGAATGLAVLSKYTGLLLAPQVGALLLLDPRGRRLLRRPWPWLGLGLAAVVFAPVLHWNLHHDWSSFTFQLDRLTHLGRPSLVRLGSFVGLQALILSPVLLVVLCAAATLAVRRWRDPTLRACAVFSLPLLGICLALSPFLWVKPNWPAPAWGTVVLAAAALFLEASGKLRGWAAAALSVAALSTAILHLVPVWSSLPMPARDDVTRGWPELGIRVGEELAKLPPPAFVLGCSYWTASELAFYVPGQPFTYGRNALGEGRGLEYQVWFSGGEIAGREGIVVLDQRDRGACTRLPQACSTLTPLEPLVVRRGAEVVTTFEIWRCRPLGPGS